MGKNIGIWIDRSKAFILDDKGSQIKKVESEVEDFNPSGGAPASTPYGNQNAGGEKEMQERQRNQMKQYVRNLSNELKDASRIVVFGPAEAKYELANEIKNNNLLKDKLFGVETSDSMSETELKQWVKNYYHPNGES